MRISWRGWLLVGTFAALVTVLWFRGSPLLNAAQPAASRGQLNEQSLGNLLAAMGLKVKKVEKRYDFSFTAQYSGEEWELSMSAVLSQNGESIWLMAWLDELPRSATDVPRTALLRLLADNDRLGKGSNALSDQNSNYLRRRHRTDHAISAANRSGARSEASAHRDAAVIASAARLCAGFPRRVEGIGACGRPDVRTRDRMG